MEYFESLALTTFIRPPKVWYRYVDDTFTILHEYDIQLFTAHLNSIDPHIQFTIEPELEGRMPFLDTCIHINNDASIKTTIYRKPTHTDQYLNFYSNHHLEHKRSVVRSLLYRADNVVSDPEDKQSEQQHICNALSANKFPKWMLDIPSNNNSNKKPTTRNEPSDKPKISLPLPYI